MLRIRRRLILLLVVVPIAFFCVLLFVTPNPLSTAGRIAGAAVLVAVAGPLSYLRVRNL